MPVAATASMLVGSCDSLTEMKDDAGSAAPGVDPRSTEDGPSLGLVVLVESAAEEDECDNAEAFIDSSLLARGLVVSSSSVWATAANGGSPSCDLVLFFRA